MPDPLKYPKPQTSLLISQTAMPQGPECGYQQRYQNADKDSEAARSLYTMWHRLRYGCFLKPELPALNYEIKSNCGWRDLNPHVFLQQILSLPRLPFRHIRKGGFKPPMNYTGFNAECKPSCFLQNVPFILSCRNKFPLWFSGIFKV